MANGWTWNHTLDIIGPLRRSSNGKFRRSVGAVIVLTTGSVGLEGLLGLCEVPTLAHQQPLFSIQDWHYQIFHPSEHQGVLVSKGGPVDTNGLTPITQPIFKLALSARSSAHGSTCCLKRVLVKSWKQIYSWSSLRRQSKSSMEPSEEPPLMGFFRWK